MREILFGRAPTAVGFSLFLVVAFITNATAEEGFDPKAEKVLRDTASFLGGADSWSYVTTSRLSVSTGDYDNESKSRLEINARRPNLFRLTQGGRMPFECISDGSHLFLSFPQMMAYMKHETPEDLEKLLVDKLGRMKILENVKLGYFHLMNDPYAALIEAVTKAEYLGKESLDGVPCHRMRLYGKPRNKDVWIESGEKPLIVRIEPDMSEAKLASPDTLGDVTIEYEIGYEDWVLDGDLPAGAFDFNPEPGSEEISEMQELSRPRNYWDMIGKPVPEVRMDLLGGGEFALADQKGKNIVFLDFWASWCGPCVYGLPHLATVAKEYKDRGVVVVAVNLGDPAEDVASFLKQRELELTVGLDRDKRLGARFGVRGIPHQVLIGKDGTVESIMQGFRSPEELKFKFDTLLSGKSLIESATDTQETPPR